MLIRRMTTSLLGQDESEDSFPGFRESFVLAFEELFCQVCISSNTRSTDCVLKDFLHDDIVSVLPSACKDARSSLY